MLERHVNQHFKPTSNKEDEGMSGKLIRRKGKKLRLRRQPFTGKYRHYYHVDTKILNYRRILFMYFMFKI